MIALTFDDGPGPTTSSILDALRTYGVPATFFVIGRNVVESPWTDIAEAGRCLLRRALAEGHTIGNHTFTHVREQNEREFVREVRETDALIKAISLEVGVPVRLPPFRLPFGISDRDPRLDFIGALGRAHVHWSRNFNDWHEGPIARLLPEIFAHIEERESAGLNSVLDLHDGGIGGARGYDRAATAEAVVRVLEESARRHWRFFTVPL
jgi:peptidoglycan/xylan/chitin deacetylase (PgdA/CDA1 family)